MLGYGDQIDNYRPDNAYLIPAGATWQSIATAVYGASNGGPALQSYLGSPVLTPGTWLHSLPATLSLTTTTTTPVTPYYTVVAGDSWASVTQAIYG